MQNFAPTGLINPKFCIFAPPNSNKIPFFESIVVFKLTRINPLTMHLQMTLYKCLSGEKCYDWKKDEKEND